MEVPKHRLKLKMNPFRKRQEIPTPHEAKPSSSTSSPCSCACRNEIEDLKKKIKAMASELEIHARIIQEFEEIQGEIFGEIADEGTVIQPETTIKDDQVALDVDDEDENGYDLERLSETLSVTEVDNEDVQMEDEIESDSFDCVIVDSVSLASSPTGHTEETHSGVSEILFPSITITDDNFNVQNNQISGGNLAYPQEVQDQNTDGMVHRQTDLPNKKRKRSRTARGITPKPQVEFTTVSLPYNCPLVCPHCKTGHVFKERGSLRRHMTHFHAEERKLFVCVPCNRSFKYKEGLTYHTRSVHEGIRHLCSVEGCSSAYSTITALRKHQRVAGHIGDGETIRIPECSSRAVYKPDT